MANDVTVKQASEVREENLRPGLTFVPNVEIRETDDALWIWADLPGVDQSSVSVELENDTLRIEGRVAADDYADLTPVYTEYNVGSFHRQFRVGSTYASDRISAKMKDGVLELQLPKAEEARPQQIPVNVQ